MIKIGVIGCGFMGSMHLNCYKAMADAQVVAVADCRAEFLATAVALTGAKGYSLGDELIASADVDIIDICLPTFLHTAHALKAMQKGRNVFIEKPVCLTEEEGKQLLAMEQKTGKFVQVGQVIRFWDEYVFLKEIIDAKKFGKVKSAYFKRISPKPNWGWKSWLSSFEMSGGAGLDLHIHDSDFMLYAFGEPEKIHSVKNTLGEKNGYVSTHAIYKDFVVVLEGGWDFPTSQPFEMAYRVCFENATVEFSSNKGIYIYPLEGDAYSPKIEKQNTINANAGGNISSLGGYFNELQYYINSVKNNTRPSKATLTDAVQSVKFVLKELQQ